MSLVRSRQKWLMAGVTLACIIGAVAAAASWSSQRQAERIARAITRGDPARAPELMRRYGCGGCHTIPGIPGADGQVGPQLSGFIHRVYIGGVAANSTDHLVQWIVAPQQLSPHSAMPATGISEAEARDVAAYLYAE
jgi:cytochrome c2